MNELFLCFWKRLLRRPVRRVDILCLSRAIVTRRDFCLCDLIFRALRLYGFNTRYLRPSAFNLRCKFGYSLYDLEVARRFGACGDEDDYWWPAGVWNTGRLAFLDYLIEEYAKDETYLVKS